MIGLLFIIFKIILIVYLLSFAYVSAYQAGFYRSNEYMNECIYEVAKARRDETPDMVNDYTFANDKNLMLSANIEWETGDEK